MNTYILIGLLNVFTLGFTQTPDSLLKLPPLIQEALQNNQQLKSSYHQWKTVETKVPQAGALPDPMVSLNLLNLPVDNFSFTRQPMTGKQIAFSQNIPFPGKLGLQKNIAEQNSIVAEMNYQEQKNQLINQVKETFYHMFFIDKAIKTSKNNSQLIQQFIHIAEIRYKVGKGLQQDLLRAQVQFSRISDRLLILKQKRETLVAQMNRLLNRQAGNRVTGAIQLDYQPHTFNLDTLKFLADSNRPLLISWEAALKQSRQKIRLAEKQYLPDFRLAVAYTQREELKNGDPGVDFFSAMMTLNIPLYFWKKQNKQVEESRYTEISIEARYAHMKDQIYEKLDQTLSSLEKNKSRIVLFQNSIIPLGRQSLSSALSAYQVDEVDFLTLIENQMTLFNDELEYFQALSQYYINLAQLEMLTGYKFDL